MRVDVLNPEQQKIDNAQDSDTRQRMDIVIIGHVDHGKSTIVGRLLADTNSLPNGKLEQVKQLCERNSKPFEYAFLIDALKDEQSQGITIDAARVFFKTHSRDYIIIDAPGHIEFLKNMVTGASRAEAALLVIDADEGIQENSKRHGYLTSMLGIKQIAVLVNKMDRIDYNQDIFNKIVKDYSEFLNNIDVNPHCFIPVSGLVGDNIVEISNKIPWYKSDTVLNTLDQFKKEELPINKPFRMSVQDVYKFTKYNDNRRIIAGSIETGSINVGDEVIFCPSGKKSKVKAIEMFNCPEQTKVSAGQATGFTLEEQIYITRGELMTKIGEVQPSLSSTIKVNLFWLGKKPMVKNKEYLFKIGTSRIKARLEEITRIIDASSLNTTADKDFIDRHDVAECIFKLNKPFGFDLKEHITITSRFVIVDDYEICGGGLVRETLQDKESWMQNKVFIRNYKWEKGNISAKDRADKYKQDPTLLLITGNNNLNRKKLAKKLEEILFNDNKPVYFLGMSNLLYGLDADIKDGDKNREEHIRRLAETVNILIDAGILTIVTASELTEDDIKLIKTSLDAHKIKIVWVGDKITTDIDYDLKVDQTGNIDQDSAKVYEYLRSENIFH